MAHKEWMFALSLIVSGSPALASQPEPVPATAPPGTPETRYCMRIEAITGTRLETVKCWTRDEWAEQGVDVDKDWPKEGVAVLQG
jgi:hypothetical protein